MSRPASRLLAFLELLQSRLVVDGASAASELGVSERTIRRYAVALHDIGIPVDGQPGAGGGYRLRAGTRLPGEGDQLSFEHPWELRAFALAVAAHNNGYYDWSEFQLALIGSIRRE